MSVQLSEAGLSALTLPEQRQAMIFFDFCVGGSRRDHMTEDDLVRVAKFCSGKDLPFWKASKLLLSIGGSWESGVTKQVFLLYLASTKVLVSRGTATSMMALPEGEVACSTGMFLRDMMDIVQRALVLVQLKQGGAFRDAAVQYLNAVVESTTTPATTGRPHTAKGGTSASSGASASKRSAAKPPGGHGRSLPGHTHGRTSKTLEQLVSCHVRLAVQTAQAGVQPRAKHVRQAAEAVRGVWETVRAEARVTNAAANNFSLAESLGEASLDGGAPADNRSTQVGTRAHTRRRQGTQYEQLMSAREQGPGQAGRWEHASKIVRLDAAAAGTAAALGQELARVQEAADVEREFLETQFEFADFQDPLLCFVRAQVAKGRRAAAEASLEHGPAGAGVEGRGDEVLEECQTSVGRGGVVSRGARTTRGGARTRDCRFMSGRRASGSAEVRGGPGDEGSGLRSAQSGQHSMRGWCGGDCGGPDEHEQPAAGGA
eukprot:jgi/Ulvmu1/4616/UM002_0345.1